MGNKERGVSSCDPRGVSGAAGTEVSSCGGRRSVETHPGGQVEG